MFGHSILAVISARESACSACVKTMRAHVGMVLKCTDFASALQRTLLGQGAMIGSRLDCPAWCNIAVEEASGWGVKSLLSGHVNA